MAEQKCSQYLVGLVCFPFVLDRPVQLTNEKWNDITLLDPKKFDLVHCYTDREQCTRSNAATARLLTLVKPAET